MTVAAYVRVSSRSQNAVTQTDAIKRAAGARNQIVELWFEEKRTAKTLERPTLAYLRELVRKGEVRTLYIFRLDRLTRSGIRDTLMLVGELRSNGCRVLSVADGFDLEGPAADVVMSVMAWAAQMERLALGERISAARTRIEAKGGKWGRPARVSEAQGVKVIALHGRDRSVRQIAAALKIPRSTVAAVLSGKGPYQPLLPAAKKPGKKPRRAH